VDQIFSTRTSVRHQRKHTFPGQQERDAFGENGRASSSKRTKHINVRYYFVTDRIAEGELKVQWCPTADKIAHYMTKPLQGKLFRRFRDLIMGLASPPERIVGSNDKTCLVLFPIGLFANKS
jgi:hypothetical protein